LLCGLELLSLYPLHVQLHVALCVNTTMFEVVDMIIPLYKITNDCLIPSMHWPWSEGMWQNWCKILITLNELTSRVLYEQLPLNWATSCIINDGSGMGQSCPWDTKCTVCTHCVVMLLQEDHTNLSVIMYVWHADMQSLCSTLKHVVKLCMPWAALTSDLLLTEPPQCVASLQSDFK